MLFNSYEFILAFLPVSLCGYYFINRIGKNRLAKIWLIACSLFFYGYFNIGYLWIIVASVTVNYGFSTVFANSKRISRRLRRILLAVGLLLNIGVLFFYKYLDFVLSTASGVFGFPYKRLGLVLPLGISFFTFQQVSFLIDSYRGQVKPYNIVDYSLFVTFFPQLIAGPIVLHSEVIPQFENPENRKLNYTNLAKGQYSFSRGLAKKVILADNFGKIVSFGYANIHSLSSFEAALTILAYTFQIYFDFSGYCDMASGIADMFNIELPINFNSPYKAWNIEDFWRRWHMTLTRFLTRYVYFPLGGNRRGKARTYINILVVFLVSGIWHGAGFTFLFWGLIHGIAQVIYRLFKKPIDKLPHGLLWLATFVFVNISWVYFRADSIPDANLMLSRLFAGGFTLNSELTETLLNVIPISIAYNLFERKGILNIILIAVMAATTAGCLLMKNTREKTSAFIPGTANLATTWILLVWSILSLSGVSTFLYFNF